MKNNSSQRKCVLRNIKDKTFKMIKVLSKCKKKIVLSIVSLTCVLLYWHLQNGNNNSVNILHFYNFNEFNNKSLNFNETSDYFTIKEKDESDLTRQYITDLSRLYTDPVVNCSRLLTGDNNYTREIIKMLPNLNETLTDDFYINVTKNCETFRQNRGYIMASLTEEEREFPISFSILAFKNSEMVERLLRAIYRPQNYYCIHVDLKSPDSFFRSISSIAKCFSNILLTRKRIDVNWGMLSVLEPELFCMQELWPFRKWKYYINLTGQEFPLRTNFELVNILKAYNGANNIEGIIKRANQDRWKNHPPPFGLRPVKGSVHITASRHFVDFILHNETALAVLNWTKTIQVPDEAYFSTLNFNPQLGLRGTYRGEPDSMKDFLTRYKIWSENKSVCAGRSSKSICIQSTGDLHRLGQAKHLFANKFYLEEDRVVIGCLEEKLLNDTRDEYLGTKTFDESYYANLDFVKNQIL